MLQGLQLALAQIKARNISENFLNEIQEPYIFCAEQKKSLKNYISDYIRYNKGILQKCLLYIYEF